jgi:hypothetical protein
VVDKMQALPLSIPQEMLTKVWFMGRDVINLNEFCFH